MAIEISYDEITIGSRVCTIIKQTDGSFYFEENCDRWFAEALTIEETEMFVNQINKWWNESKHRSQLQGNIQ